MSDGAGTASGIRRAAGRLAGLLGGRFALFHLVNSSLTFVLSFAQLYVFVRVLEPGFYGTVVLVTAISIYLVPLDGALSRVGFVRLRNPWLDGRRTDARGTVYRLYAAWAALQLGVVAAGFGAATLAGAGWLARPDLLAYLLFCLAVNFWHYEVQALGWALDLGLAYERIELARRIANALLLALLLATGSFALYAVLMLALSVAATLLFGRPLARAGAGLAGLGGLRPAGLGAALREARHDLGGATAGSAAELMLMTGPYAIVAAALGAGPALIVLDTCLKLLRAIVTALRICAEALLPRQSAALQAGDHRRLVRTLGLIVALSSLPAVAVCGALLLAGEALFGLLLGPLAGLMPAETALVMVPLVAAALVHSLAVGFLAFSGFFADLVRVARVAALAMAGLAAVTLAGGLDVAGFLRGWALAFAVAAAVAALLAGLRIRRLAPAAAGAATPALAPEGRP